MYFILVKMILFFGSLSYFLVGYSTELTCIFVKLPLSHKTCMFLLSSALPPLIWSHTVFGVSIYTLYIFELAPTFLKTVLNQKKWDLKMLLRNWRNLNQAAAARGKKWENE